MFLIRERELFHFTSLSFDFQHCATLQNGRTVPNISGFIFICIRPTQIRPSYLFSSVQVVQCSNLTDSSNVASTVQVHVRTGGVL